MGESDDALGHVEPGIALLRGDLKPNFCLLARMA